MTGFVPLLQVSTNSIPVNSAVTMATIELAPREPGSPPHRHSGPVFGYLLEGELSFQVECEPERIIRTGEAFWEPGGDVIHYRAANNLSDGWTRFVVVLLGTPGEPILTVVDETERG